MDEPSRQEAPAQTLPATQHGVIGRLKNIGPVAVIATGAVIALPLAGHEFGIRPTILAVGIAVVVIGACWLIGRERRRQDDDRDRARDRGLIRREAALRRRVADLEIAVLQLADRTTSPASSSGSPYAVGYLAGVRRRLGTPASSGPATRMDSRGPDRDWG